MCFRFLLEARTVRPRQFRPLTGRLLQIVAAACRKHRSALTILGLTNHNRPITEKWHFALGVGLSIRSHVSKTTCPNFAKFPVDASPRLGPPLTTMQ